MYQEHIHVTVSLSAPQGRSGRSLAERPSHRSASRIHHRSCAEVSALKQATRLHTFKLHDVSCVLKDELSQLLLCFKVTFLACTFPSRINCTLTLWFNNSLSHLTY